MSENNLIHSLESKHKKNSSKPFFIGGIILTFALILGIGAGFLLARISASSNNSSSTAQKIEQTDKKGGILDKKTFKDQAEGTLKADGINGEGNFHLERTGGESQNVSLTSSTVDLSPYLNKKVRVWGQTFSSSKAGWLMDVGYVEVL
ncbi:hypothetical protein HGA88_00935 [Candidatus Roizmanbacteria bacterium]|nr:hypothetical protein [Candidatus Roizmanbacteria bacterium]